MGEIGPFVAGQSQILRDKPGGDCFPTPCVCKPSASRYSADFAVLLVHHNAALPGNLKVGYNRVGS